MFDVYNKEALNKIGVKLERKTVYSVQYKNGYPFFTFYENGQWITRSAKHYIPIKI